MTPYDIGVVGENYEDLFTFEDIGFKLPATSDCNTYRDYIGKCERAIRLLIAPQLRPHLLLHGIQRIDGKWENARG